LNPVIPFYRLPEAMRGIVELQSPVITRLTPREMMRCFRLNLWDPETRRMASFREAYRGSQASVGL
jgi:omega-6 fatty acid desaturase (delta-12 desaturase)